MKKSFRYGIGVLVASSLLVNSISTMYFVSRTGAQTSGTTTFINPCTNTSTSLTSGMTLAAIQPISVYVSTTDTSTAVNRVIILADGNPIGEAKKTSTYSWNMPWATSLISPGNHLVSARLIYNQTNTCQTGQISVIVPTNTTTMSLAMDVLPTNWSGPTNSGAQINTNVIVNGMSTSPYVIKDYAIYEWDTNIGSLQPSRDTAYFSSGPSAGMGRVRIKAIYGGRDVVREVPIGVQSQTSTTTNTDTTSSGGTTSTGTTSGTTSSTTNNQTTTSTNTTTTTSGSSGETSTATTTAAETEEPKPLTREEKIERATTQLQSQPEVLNCATASLTPARIESLRTQTDRLTASELRIIRGCFAPTKFAVPAVYAPVEPQKTVVKELPSSEKTRINDTTTHVTNSEDGTTRAALRFQGQAEPNTDVLVYVFSEPIVLYAKADDNGNWVYDLVDPLAPGNHEAYAVVEEADGTYKKSSAFSFLIKTAEASAENPNGYSLAVENVASLNPPPSKQGINMYIIGSGVIVFLVLGVGTVIFVRTMKHIPPESSGGASGTGE